MKTYSFKIKGNQENKLGNPIPYFRTTQKSKWNPGAQRYEAWKGYVRGALFDTGCPFTVSMVNQYMANLPPLVLERGERAYMDILIYWADETHADADNIFKGIADALFFNDKHLCGSFYYVHGDEGMVEVQILISNSDKDRKVDVGKKVISRIEGG